MNDAQKGATLPHEALSRLAVREAREEALDRCEALLFRGELRGGEHGRASRQRREEKGEKLLEHLLGLGLERGGELTRGEALLELVSEQSGLSP